jgi:hypothetical protein
MGFAIGVEFENVMFERNATQKHFTGKTFRQH